MSIATIIVTMIIEDYENVTITINNNNNGKDKKKIYVCKIFRKSW